MDNCKKCNSELNGNYCSNCGYPAKIRRIDAHYIKDEIRILFNLERGFFFTIKELIIRPGQNIRRFIAEDRNRLVKPITFLIVTSLIYSLIVNFFHAEEQYINYEIKSDDGEEELAVLQTIFEWIQSHYGYANLIMGFLMALFAKIFYRKYGYNYFEILILLCFVSGIEMLIVSFFGIIEGFAKIQLQEAAVLISFIYAIWAIGHFFEKKMVNYLKAFVIYILGGILFIASALCIGLAIDLIF